MARLGPTGLTQLLTDIKNWVLSKIPTKTSQLTNDSNYLTSHQSLSNYSTLANTVKSISISGKTITVTPGSGSAYTLTTQDTNTDTLVTQNVSTANNTYPILLCATANATANQGAKTSIFGSGVKVNPANSAIVANALSGVPSAGLYVTAVKDGGALINAQTTTFGTVWRAPTKNYQVGAATFPSNGDIVYICYSVTNDNVTAGTNTVTKQLVWDAGTGALTADSFSGNAATATQFSSNATVTLTGDATGTSAGSKKSWSVPVTLANSGVTAGTYGPSADVTGNNNSTISVPQITVDAKGRVTSVVNRTLTCKNNTYSVYNKTLTIQKNGTNVATFTSNSNADVTANITVPTKTSELTNDSGYLTSVNAYLENTTARDANTINNNGITYYNSNGPATSLGASTTDGALFTQFHNSKWIAQIAQDYRNGNLFTRGKNNNAWQAWKAVAYHGDNVSKFNNDAGYITGSGNTTGSSGSCTGNAATATQFSANTTVALTGDATGTSAGSKKGWSVPVTLANSGVTAGSYGPSAAASPGHNGTFSVPYITVDAKGRVTAASSKTITLPADSNTDTQVTQTVTTSNSYYPVILGHTADQTATETSVARFSKGFLVNARYSFLYIRNTYNSENTKGVRGTATYTNALQIFQCYDGTEMGRLFCESNKGGYTRVSLRATNYIKDGAIATDGTATHNSLSLDVKDDGSKHITIDGNWDSNLTPATNNSKTLGTSSLKWKAAYAVNFYENGTALSSKYAQIANISADGIGTTCILAYFPTGTSDFSLNAGVTKPGTSLYIVYWRLESTAVQTSNIFEDTRATMVVNKDYKETGTWKLLHTMSQGYTQHAMIGVWVRTA